MLEDKWERKKYEWKISNFTRENVEKRKINDDNDDWVNYEQKIVKCDNINGCDSFSLEFYDDEMSFDAPDALVIEPAKLKVALQTTDSKLDYCFDQCEYVKIDDIFNNSKYLTEDSLTIVIHTEKYLNEYHYDYYNEDGECDCGYEAHEALSEMCDKLFNSEDFSDVKIVCNDGIEYPAHQCILASRSPVFYAMLTCHMLEKNTQRIEIDDIDGEAMLEVLRFIYTDTVEDLDNLASTLIFAAEKYDLPWLKKMCRWKLVQRMSAKRALKHLKIADCVDEPLLLEESLSCINANVAELEETDEWKAMDCALMAKITAYIEEKAADVIKLKNSL